MFAIMGSGFGLYGYLPALIEAGSKRVILPERYKPKLIKRPELAQYSKNIQWYQDDNEALNYADAVVLALRPIEHEDWINRCIALDNIQYLLLEKPLTNTPEKAEKVFHNLIQSKKVFRIGFIFRFTIWANAIMKELKSINSKEHLKISWLFMAHHFEHDLKNWKRCHVEGGGAIRFYGIHLIALLAELGYCEVLWSKVSGTTENELEKWTAIFSGGQLPECEVKINTRSRRNMFKVELDEHAVADLHDPFDQTNADSDSINADHRIPLLNQLYNSISEENANIYEWYNATINLWGKVEKNTEFELLPN